MKLLISILATTLSLGLMAKSELTKVRIGWQIPWATQGQIVQILKHTDILKNNGLEAEFIGRTYGPLLNELALSNEVDVVLTADQPAIALFSKDKGWLGVGRLMYNRTLTYVSPESKINKLKDLKTKTIAIPIGAAAERITLQALEREGMSKKDYKVINLGIREQVPLVANKSWGNIDALSGFDPLPAIFESKGLIKVLDVGKVCSMVLMNENFISKNKNVAVKMMRSIRDAYDFYRNNIEKANNWFMAEAKLKDANHKACNIAASIEPNVWVKNKSEISHTFSAEDFKILESASKFMAPKIKKNVDVKKFVTNKYVESL